MILYLKYIFSYLILCINDKYQDSQNRINYLDQLITLLKYICGSMIKMSVCPIARIPKILWSFY